MKIFHVFLMSLMCLMCFTSLHADAQASYKKTKIAVLDFRLQGNDFGTDDMGKIVAEWLITAFVREGRFEVVERKLLGELLEEQKMAESGIVDQETASEIGKLLGVKVIISGSVVKIQDVVEVNARIVDVASASIITAESVSSREVTSLRQLVKEMAGKIIKNFPLEGYIANRSKNNVVIDLGRQSGVKSGMTFLVYKEGEVVKHPKTGEILYVSKIEIGRIKVTSVQDKIATGTILNEIEQGGIGYGDLIKSSVNETLTSLPKKSPPAKVVKAKPVTKYKSTKKKEKKQTPTEMEIVFWESIKDSKDERLFRAYLNKYPNGAFAEIAKISIETYGTTASQPIEKSPEVQAVSKTPPAKRDRNDPLKVAIFPWRFLDDAHYMESLLTGNIQVVVGRYQCLQLSHSYYKFSKKYGIESLADNSSLKQTKQIWGMSEPKIDNIVAIGKQIGVDAVMLGSMRVSNPWSDKYNLGYIKTFVIDVHSGQKIYFRNKSAIGDARDELPIVLQNAVGEYSTRFCNK